MLTLIQPDGPGSTRCQKALGFALADLPYQELRDLSQPLQNRRILFVLRLNEGGAGPEFYRLLSHLRTHPGCLEGCVGGVVVDGAGELYTKAAARDLVLSANLAGCAFPGRPLVEATGSLANFSVQAKNAGCDLAAAYCLALRGLVGRIGEFAPPKVPRPRLLVLHASNHQTSNTLALWAEARQRLQPFCDITEIPLRNGTLEDCVGCPYTMCLHFGEKGTCFYGGVISTQVYPALTEADGVVFLCPNYNDAVSANLTAAINRLTALYRVSSFSAKALLGIVVSGYSGGDIVASQLVSALCMNKGFYLPPRFCLLETANDPGAALRLPGIQGRLEDFAQALLRQLKA